jgi:hypothetical protein
MYAVRNSASGERAVTSLDALAIVSELPEWHWSFF